MIGKQKKRTEETLERLRGLSRLGELLMEEGCVRTEKEITEES